jgi:hypothetical protein
VNTEDQAAAMFAKANPVPSIDLLDPIEAVDVERLGERFERSRGMSQVKVEPRQLPDRPKSRLIPALGLTAVVVIALGVLLTQQSGVSSPIEVADRYMEARRELDLEAVEDLLAQDAVVNENGWRLGDMPALFAWYRASSWSFMPDQCSEVSTGATGTFVNCTYQFENVWTRSLGDEPATGEILILVSEGAITEVVGFLNTASFNDGWQSFVAWVRENQPDDYEAMFAMDEVLWHPGPSPLIDPGTTALWERYTEEFLADMGS